jgi:hypothetical protein
MKLAEDGLLIFYSGPPKYPAHGPELIPITLAMAMECILAEVKLARMHSIFYLF